MELFSFFFIEVCQVSGMGVFHPPNLSLRSNTQHTAAVELAHNTTSPKDSKTCTPKPELQYQYQCQHTRAAVEPTNNTTSIQHSNIHTKIPICALQYLMPIAILTHPRYRILRRRNLTKLVNMPVSCLLISPSVPTRC